MYIEMPPMTGWYNTISHFILMNIAFNLDVYRDAPHDRLVQHYFRLHTYHIAFNLDVYQSINLFYFG